MSAGFAWIGRFSVRFRWLIVAVWVIGTMAATAMLPSLGGVVQDNNSNFLPSSSQSIQAARLGSAIGATTETLIPVVVARTDGQLTSSDDSALARLETDLQKADSSIVGVRDLGRSANGQAEELDVIASGLGGGGLDLKAQGVIDDVRAKVLQAALPAGLQAHLAGDVATQVDNQSNDGANAMMDVSMLFIIVILLFIFRSLLAPVLTLIPAAMAVLLAQPLIAEWGHHGLKVAQIGQLLMIVLVLGAGTDYGLFLVFRVREELREGRQPKDAVVHALARVGESITFSAGTVIAALLSLLAATFSLYSNLAVPLAVGIGAMLLAGLTLLPALLAIFGRAAFWPSKVRPGAEREGLWSKVSASVVRRPAITLTAGVIIFAALASAASMYVAGGFGGKTTAPTGSDSAAGDALLARYFPGASPNPTGLIFQLPNSVWKDAAPVAAGGSELASSTSLFTSVRGPLNPTGTAITPAELTSLYAQLGNPASLPPAPPAGASVSPALYEAYRATANYVSTDGHTIQFSTSLAAGDPEGSAALNAVPAIRARTTAVAQSMGASASGVVGEAASDYDISNLANSDLMKVVPIAILVIGIILALVLRSLVAPLYLIVSVALSFLAALGLSTFVFMKLVGDSGITFFLPFLMFIFLLALGEDYNILVMTRIREEVRRLPLREAVVQALRATGTTVTSAGLVLAGTFTVFAIVGSQSMGSDATNVGVGLAIGVLMDTFLVRTLLVPSTVVLLGRSNWWPSRRGRSDEAEKPRVPLADGSPQLDPELG